MDIRIVGRIVEDKVHMVILKINTTIQLIKLVIMDQ
jgi:hypothetical protein